MKDNSTESMREKKLIDPTALENLMNSGAPCAVLDVRERGEYALGQIYGAVSAPRGLLEVCIKRLVPQLGVRIALYCDDGHRSDLAAQTLGRLGYEDVSVLAGGLRAWSASGRPTSYGVNLIGKDYGERVAVESNVPQLSPQELLDMQQHESVLILDSRTEQEYLKGHIPGARNVPGGELPLTVLTLVQQHAAGGAIVVHCAGRTRSILGADLLRRMGFEKAYALRNGTMAWFMEGLELERGMKRLPVHGVSDSARTDAASFARSYAKEVNTRGIGIDHLQTIRNSGVLHYLIDVRLLAEFHKAHIPGAIACPAGQLANGADDYIAVRSALVVCHSNDATRAQIGAGTLRRIGYPNVAWLEGGLLRWTKRGLPIESGTTIVPASVPDLEVAERTTEAVASDRLADALKEPEAVHVIDVRRSSEYATGHVDGSHWVPRGDLERRIGDHVVSPDADLVVVSGRGIRAALACHTLRGLGYLRVRRLAGGLAAWVAAGQSLVEGLDGANVSLREAKEDVDLTGMRARVLERNRDDMLQYLEWEETLGEKYK